MTFLMMFTATLLADYTAHFCKCDQASDLGQQLELTSELQSDQ